ncbi:hypothetical protein CHLRE_03g201888v5 [Chlamydomonas reinhardtii]|uniref:Uncharacterized protein n=1 Tax=Chlamydomonas reinhardtii TaxID=3055 RepID=A0A2K3DZL1_CHLRE|nr:uncharacterized protein CHLRE_03g201888v5 [Chlamydomonas reinhardtii]PNW85982.1 hypothetical protein CHLRE_03g201888v5 [Chlamydomonas reinhardtii]
MPRKVARAPPTRIGPQLSGLAASSQALTQHSAFIGLVGCLLFVSVAATSYISSVNERERLAAHRANMAQLQAAHQENMAQLKAAHDADIEQRFAARQEHMRQREAARQQEMERREAARQRDMEWLAEAIWERQQLLEARVAAARAGARH